MKLHDGVPRALSELANPADEHAAIRDFWMYLVDERRKIPLLWRIRIRVHACAFRYAFPGLAISDTGNWESAILQDVVAAVQAAEKARGPEGGAGGFRLQVPIFPAECLAPEFAGTLRGWFSIGVPELVH